MVLQIQRSLCATTCIAYTQSHRQKMYTAWLFAYKWKLSAFLWMHVIFVVYKDSSISHATTCVCTYIWKRWSMHTEPSKLHTQIHKRTANARNNNNNSTSNTNSKFVASLIRLWSIGIHMSCLLTHFCSFGFCAVLMSLHGHTAIRSGKNKRSVYCWHRDNHIPINIDRLLEWSLNRR